MSLNGRACSLEALIVFSVVQRFSRSVLAITVSATVELLGRDLGFFVAHTRASSNMFACSRMMEAHGL